MDWPWCKPPPTPVLEPDSARELLIAALALLAGALTTLVFVVALKSDRKEAPAAAPPSTPPAAAAAELSVTKHATPTSITPELLQALCEARRSVQPKDYTGAAVADEQVRAILAAAPWAPNHGKTEPWRFAVYSGSHKQALLDLTLRWYETRPAAFWQQEFILAKTGQPEFSDGAAFASYFRKAAADKWGAASHLVVIGVRRQRPVEGKKQFPTWEEDCAVACAVQNMHLLATTLRVGAYWSSWYAHYRASDECVRDVFGLEPDLGDRCLGVFVIGAISPELSIRASRLPMGEITQWKE